MTDISKHYLLRQCHEVMQAVEACGASPAITHAVTLAGDLMNAIGNHVSGAAMDQVVDEHRHYGDFKCPMCGDDFPHTHDPREVIIYRNGVKYGRSLIGDMKPAVDATLKSMKLVDELLEQAGYREDSSVRHNLAIAAAYLK